MNDESPSLSDIGLLLSLAVLMIGRLVFLSYPQVNSYFDRVGALTSAH
jgi:hypothetical protein